MNFAEALAAALILYLALSRNAISDYRLITFIMSCAFVSSFISSLTIPYIKDDMDYFYNLTRAIDTHQVLRWLMTPVNEHVIFLEKLIYLFCYKSFWLYPEFFHVVVLLVVLGIVVLIYRLIFIFTQSSLTAFIGASIMAANNLTDEAVFVSTNSSILFCILLLLLLFYAIYRFAQTQELYWRLVAFFSILLAPLTFASGLTSIIFVLLFYFLCLSLDLQQRSKNLFPLLFIGWLLSLIPYIYFMNGIIYTDHYQDIGLASIFGAARFLLPVKFLSYYIVMKLIPGLVANIYLSFGLFFLCFFTIIKYSKEIAWRRILFFISFGLVNNFIIYVFRSQWGTEVLETSRYDAFPITMMAFSYAFILDVFVKQTPHIKKISILMIVYVLCFFAVVNGGLYRFSNGNQLFKGTVMTQLFYNNFRKIFVDYFDEHDVTQLKLKSIEIDAPFSRYPRSTEFCAQFILPSVVNKKIVWSKKTDPQFLSYLKVHQYVYLTNRNNK